MRQSPIYSFEPRRKLKIAGSIPAGVAKLYFLACVANVAWPIRFQLRAAHWHTIERYRSSARAAGTSAWFAQSKPRMRRRQPNQIYKSEALGLGLQCQGVGPSFLSESVMTTTTLQTGLVRSQVGSL